MSNIALVVGASGITGSNLAKQLLTEGWETYGLARNPTDEISGLNPVTADLLDKRKLQIALADISPTHIYITTWMRNATEAENIRVNGLMIRNLLDVLSPKKSVQHVALVTGLKHYLGPFEAYAREGFLPETPLREEHPRLNMENFYYAQEDEIYAAAERDGFSWSVHRPHTVIGQAVGNAMNLGTTLAVYASICKETGRPFIFPGSAAQWNGLSDVTDARVLAAQLLWASTTVAARNQAFNIVNGDVFRWSRLWNRIAAYFGVEAAGFDGTIHPLEQTMANDGQIWQQIAEKYELKEAKLTRLASPWHTDLDLGRPIEVMTDMSKSRKLGFTAYQDTEESFYDLIEQLRTSRLIP
ncbi:SDR family oxidoreductase [Mucilaginibacter gotjawali]|uniref:GDP-6-deoxy-D-mannose reductase n=2 Tax=Mucilaginibacter gotjawali TaxID=1550579 RepID=A0A0X8X3Y9_9SPHI|nr:SDR family oxidoreductase [Mucilaginibacter gotjawali]MBB3055885.1 nucleoside-diphosphate-sugar epimerase [Mucilaginibacter gotjawali]BAU54707.1 GDP-6-deoxy-D-mannose reductase [Mucilaginibacter gotjawali]